MDNARPLTIGYADRPPIKLTDWHGLVAWDVFFNNLATGLFLVSAVCELAAPQLFRPLARLAYPLALLILLVDLTLLVLDLGDPFRFHHMLRVFKPSSPMSFGVWSLSAFAFALTGTALLAWLIDEFTMWEMVRRLTVAATLLPALGSLIYKGVLFSTSSQPVWKDARWLGAYLASSALVLGTAGLLGLALVMATAVTTVQAALMGVLVVHLLPAGLFVRDIVRWGEPARQRLAAKRWGGAIVLGVLVPMGILSVTRNEGAAYVAIAILWAGALLVRFMIIHLPRGAMADAARSPSPSV